jgi:hypothetical protein
VTREPPAEVGDDGLEAGHLQARVPGRLRNQEGAGGGRALLQNGNAQQEEPWITRITDYDLAYSGTTGT